MFGHVSRQIALEERAEVAEVAEEPFHLVVDFVDMSLKLVFVVGVATQATNSSFVELLGTSAFVKRRFRELFSFVENILVLVNDFIVVQILFCESRVNDVLNFGFHFNINTSGRIFSVLMFNVNSYVFQISVFIVWISEFFNDSIHKFVKARLLVNKVFAKLTEAPEVVVAPLTYYTRVVVVVF